MFHHARGRRRELLDRGQGGVGVEQVDVRKLLAVELTGVCNGRLGRLLIGIQGGGLVGVFAVAERLGFLEPEVERVRERRGS
jgi:hypothetical protein